MGHVAGVHAPEARVPRERRIARRRILKGVPPLRFGEGHDCTFPASLAIASKTDYDWVMGCSAIAFTTTIDAAGWDPLAAVPSDPKTRERAARALGLRLDEVSPPYDDEMRSLVGERVAEAIDTELPPLVRGLGGPPEYGLLVGYDETVPVFFARTFFDRTDEPRRVGWEAFENESRGTPIFLDRATPPDRAEAVRAGIDAGLTAGDMTDNALASWAEAVRDEARWSDTKHAGTAAFADHAMRAILVDKRRAAARFLRSSRGLFPNAPGGDLLRAAESFGYGAEVAAKGGLGEFDGGVAMRFLDVGHRRAWAKNLDAVREHDREAREALAAARTGMR
jgi:hypothetical protein